MTHDDVMALANQTAGQHWMDEAHIQRFAALVAAAEREACAAICDSYSEFRWSWWKARADPLDQGASDAADELAQRIRSRT